MTGLISRANFFCARLQFPQRQQNIFQDETCKQSYKPVAARRIFFDVTGNDLVNGLARMTELQRALRVRHEAIVSENLRTLKEKNEPLQIWKGKERFYVIEMLGLNQRLYCARISEIFTGRCSLTDLVAAKPMSTGSKPSCAVTGVSVSLTIASTNSSTSVA